MGSKAAGSHLRTGRGAYVLALRKMALSRRLAIKQQAPTQRDCEQTRAERLRGSSQPLTSSGQLRLRTRPGRNRGLLTSEFKGLVLVQEPALSAQACSCSIPSLAAGHSWLRIKLASPVQAPVAGAMAQYMQTSTSKQRFRDRLADACWLQGPVMRAAGRSIC